MDLLLFFAFISIGLIITAYLIQHWSINKQKEEIRERIYELSNYSLELTASEFLELRNKSFGGKGRTLHSNNFNFSGVYILHNKTKDLYYVGQGKQVLNRVNSRFTGKGNGDVYADYKYGDEWTIKTISLRVSGYRTLNELERYSIEAYNSYVNGYNRTRGNKS